MGYLLYLSSLNAGKLYIVHTGLCLKPGECSLNTGFPHMQEHQIGISLPKNLKT
jgi:hypothetical protein